MIETLLEAHEERLVVGEADRLLLQHAAELRQRPVAGGAAAPWIDVNRHRPFRHLVVDAVDMDGESAGQCL